jgi:hypothetical protein
MMERSFLTPRKIEGRKELTAMSGKPSFLTGLFLVVVALLGAVSLLPPVFAFDRESNSILESGSVVAIDSQAGYLTLQTPDEGQLPVALDQNTDVWKCDHFVGSADIKAGDTLDISFHDSGTGLVADAINDHARKC